MKKLPKSPARLAVAGVMLLALTGCEALIKKEEETLSTGADYEVEKTRSGWVTGGLIGGKDDKKNAGRAGPAMGGANPFLWRAALDTTSFMPLRSADVFAGVIITDWYTPPETPDERLKLTVYILDRELRADGLRVAVFRQRRDSGGWVQAKINPKTATDLENAILTRARQLWVDSARLNK